MFSIPVFLAAKRAGIGHTAAVEAQISYCQTMEARRVAELKLESYVAVTTAM